MLSHFVVRFTHLVHAGYLNDRWHERASNAIASKTILSVRDAMISLRGGPRDPLLLVTTEMHRRAWTLINANYDNIRIGYTFTRRDSLLFIVNYPNAPNFSLKIARLREQ